MSLILLVDDIAEIRDTIVSFLESSGYEVITATDVSYALELLNETLANRSKVPDLILCDVNLPYLPGVELFNLTRSNPMFKTIPFVFKTFADKAPNCQYTDILTGPITQNKLLQVIAQWTTSM